MAESTTTATMVVVHTFIEHMRVVTVRIISARLATRNERRSYEDAHEG
jgi:uncharacterized DUF497 family protein